MPHVVLIEPEGFLRSLVRPHLGAMGEDFEVVASVDEAQARARNEAALLVLARGSGDPRYAAELACAFDVYAAIDPVRLIVLEIGAEPLRTGKAATSYLHEIDRTLAGITFAPPSEPEDARLGLARDFPRDTYHAISRVGELACGLVLLVRNRVSGLKELLVQTADEHPDAGCVAEALYRNLRERPGVHMLRHEVARHHSFISSSSLPFDLARQAGLAA